MFDTYARNYNQNNPEKILIKRNSLEERELRYTKIYDLSKIDRIPNLTPQEKTKLLLTIKALLLSTNEYIDIGNNLEISRYIIFSQIIFIFYMLIFAPIYKNYFSKEDLTEPNPSLSNFIRFLSYNLIELFELIFRFIFNYFKRKKVRKIMTFFGKTELKKISEYFIIDLNKNNYDLTIQRTNTNNYISFCRENQKIKVLNEKYNFYNYVINYPNMRYYRWDKNILNDKEKEIVNSVLRNLNEIETQYVRKYSLSVVVIWIFYLLCFKCLVLGQLKEFFIYRVVVFLFTKIFSIFMSMDYRSRLAQREEILSKNYIPQGYFILLNSAVIEIFKLKENFTDNTVFVEENFKRLSKEINDFNEKIKNLE